MRVLILLAVVMLRQSIKEVDTVERSLKVAERAVRHVKNAKCTYPPIFPPPPP